MPSLKREIEPIFATPEAKRQKAEERLQELVEAFGGMDTPDDSFLTDGEHTSSSCKMILAGDFEGCASEPNTEDEEEAGEEESTGEKEAEEEGEEEEESEEDETMDNEVPQEDEQESEEKEEEKDDDKDIGDNSDSDDSSSSDDDGEACDIDPSSEHESEEAEDEEQTEQTETTQTEQDPSQHQLVAVTEDTKENALALRNSPWAIIYLVKGKVKHI